MTATSVRCSGLAVVAVAAACAPPGDSGGSRFEDTRAPTPATAAPRIEGDESLSALTAEVRQLRVAVEDLARGQSQAQALAVYLSAQQARVLQATQLLDAARKELDSATARSRDVEAQVARFSEQLSGTTDRQERAALEDALRAHQTEANAADLALQRARTREGDLSLALSREEDRWGDLVARLEALTR